MVAPSKYYFQSFAVCSSNPEKVQYEVLLDEEDLNARRKNTFLTRLACLTVTVLVILSMGGLRSFPGGSGGGGGITSTTASDAALVVDRRHEHTIPTLLSVVHHETGKYLVALNNPLYERLNQAVLAYHYDDDGDDDDDDVYHDKDSSNSYAMMTMTVVNGHHHHQNKKIIMEMPSLHLDRFTIGVRDPLTLSWTLGLDQSGATVLKDEDVIALYCGDQIWETDLRVKQFLDAATIAQARATSQKHSSEMYMSHSSSGGGDSTDGDTEQQQQQWHFPSFPVLRHDVCQFTLFQALPTHSDNNNNNGGKPSYVLLGSSDVFNIASARTTPTAIHLAVGDVPSEMMVQFATGYQEGTPVARFSKQGSKTDASKASGTTHTYTADDLCEAPGNITEPGKFQPPGLLHVVPLTDLEPNTVYEYQVGLAHGQGITWSDSFSFTSAPETGNQEPFSYLVYGDQGCPANGWGDGGAWTSAMTAREVLNPNNELPIRSIHIFGDISYAKGAAHVWDDYFNMISSFSTKVPLHVSIGNHEYDHLAGGDNGKDPSGVSSSDGYHPEWGNFHNDSGGECGVPIANRFTMPNSTNSYGRSNGVFWYSFNYGSVHTTVISSEHDLSPGSVQYQWLKADLMAVNRTLTPWVVLETHRPFYESEINYADNAVGVVRRYELDDLLRDYKVDLVLGGHYHSYLRTCDGLYNSKCNNGGPTHITIGTAGAALNDWSLYENDWTESFLKLVYGYGRITVANASAMHFEFVKAGSNDTKSDVGQTLDHVWILRDR